MQHIEYPQWKWASFNGTYFGPDDSVFYDRNKTYIYLDLQEGNLDVREGKRLELVIDGKYGYTRMLRRQIEGKNNSWAIRWNASLFLKGILSLNVGRSLVQNEGFDGSGTHCGGGGLYATTLYPDRLPVVRISPIEENAAARRAYVRYYARTNSFFAKALRRIKRTLRGDFGA